MKGLTRILLAGLLLVATGTLAEDEHLRKGPDSALFQRSAFAHGYLHGYQEGFHHGDLNVQLDRQAQNPTALNAYRHPFSAFHRDFGSKSLYKAGYESGFRAGYSDVLHDLSFRAIGLLRTANQGLGEKFDSGVFDRAFKDGYEGGVSQGANDGRDGAVANPIKPPCLGKKREYCDAFNRGFALGYEDGYANQRSSHPGTLQAQAQAK